MADPAGARTTYDKVRSALGGDAAQYPDDDLSFPVGNATQLVDNRLAPYTAADLTTTETYLAAYLAVDTTDPDNQGISSVKQSSRKISFATGGDDSTAAELWEKAVLFDPTGRLDDLADDDKTATVRVPDVKGS
jgi:hypothetical protein